MGWKSLERNELDFILTDLMPVELSDRFTFYYFYEFLLKKENLKQLNFLVQKLKEKKAKGTTLIFRNNWATCPLKYKIMKGNGTFREMSLMQPLSALNVYFFIQCYRKEILSYFKKNHIFSIRYHKNNTDLSYKTSKNKVTSYFLKSSQEIKKIAIQQAGNFFKIVPFSSINSFTDSNCWQSCNFKFKHFAKIDYKSCFDSIYSHVFSWVIEPHMIDAKKANNTNLFIEIDRILQNINGRSSNGILIGPEFSRMIAEILLQHIDQQVYLALEANGFKYKQDYRIFRYVDDVFIFANDNETIDTIINLFQMVASQFRLNINELKINKEETPSLPKMWLEETRIVADKIDSMFFQGSKKDFEAIPPSERSFVLKTHHISRIKDQVSILVKKYPHEKRTVVSFLLSTLLNKVSSRKNGYQLFKSKESAVKRSIPLLDLAFFIYAFFPSFEQTEKIISLITYINQEAKFQEQINISTQRTNNQLNRILHKYDFIFENGNLHDLCDWFPFLYENKLNFSPKIEDNLIKKAIQLEDPIILANLLLYSQYYKFLNCTWSKQINHLVEKLITRLHDKELIEFREFWFIIIFYNCPYLSSSTIGKISNIINQLAAQCNLKHINESSLLLICRFMQNNQSGFFDWSCIKKFGERIIYRTYKRTMFKHYKKRSYGLYVSLD